MSTRDHPDWWRPVGGQNSQESSLERRSLMWNDNDILDGVDPPASYLAEIRHGKFFPRGCRGMIEQIQIYIEDNALGDIVLQYSPHPCLGPLGEVTITATADWGWRAGDIERIWDYDSLFIWVHECDVGVNWAYDTEQPYDGHEGILSLAEWAALDIRPFIRAVYTGETPGDVPVSGIVNTIEIPAVTSRPVQGTFMAVESDNYTALGTAYGIGTFLEAKLELWTSVTPTAGLRPAAVVYEVAIQADEGFPVLISNRDLTQSFVATSGRGGLGEFYQGTVADPAWDRTHINVRIPVKFWRSLTLRIYHSVGVNVRVVFYMWLNMNA